MHIVIHNYLSNSKQEVKINDKYSSWSEIFFYFIEEFDIANYVDDSTPYFANKSAEFLASNLEQSSTILFEWLNNNFMKVNAGKSHL